MKEDKGTEIETTKAPHGNLSGLVSGENRGKHKPQCCCGTEDERIDQRHHRLQLREQKKKNDDNNNNNKKLKKKKNDWRVCWRQLVCIVVLRLNAFSLTFISVHKGGSWRDTAKDVRLSLKTSCVTSAYANMTSTLQEMHWISPQFCLKATIGSLWEEKKWFLFNWILQPPLG